MDQSKSLEKPVSVVTDDRRLTMRLMGLWQDSRFAGEPFARAEQFMAELPDELLSDCCFIEKGADGRWLVHDIGATIGRCSGVAAASVKIDDLPPGSLIAVAVDEIYRAYKYQTPIVNEGHARDKDGRKTLFRSILVPLADASGETTSFVAGARCRVCIHDN
ncbi:MAG: hypothetical protein R3229_11340 [Alphaproteobacteria bacterium]|nr:hypothetical protein [Alphaproteobacteria bacterium]